MIPDRLPFGHAYLPRVPVPDSAAPDLPSDHDHDCSAGIVIGAERRFVRGFALRVHPTGRSAA